MKIDRSIFGLFLFAKRLCAALSVRAVAKQAGVPARSIALAEGRRPIPDRDFRRLCEWQGEDPALFMRGEQ